jgi:uroporphyrinogen decarboxylase
MTLGCEQRLREHLGAEDLAGFVGSHFIDLGSRVGRFEDVGNDHVRDPYGVVWDRTVDKDIGTPSDWPIKTPADLDNYQWPDVDNDAWYAGVAETRASRPDLYGIYHMGFTLYERAWTMRGMTNLLMDMIERPEFVQRLLDAIVEHNLVQLRRALEFDVDAVHFGDDYGMQTGLIMGIDKWRRFLKPQLARMFAEVRGAGKYVHLHSCGAVAELFDDLVEIGLNVFNPFQPEVMDIFAIKQHYHGRLAFHGGMSIQKILPFGSVSDVCEMTQQLIDAGRDGGYLFAPSHSIPPDVPAENLVAMMEVLRTQPGAPGA